MSFHLFVAVQSDHRNRNSNLFPDFRENSWETFLILEDIHSAEVAVALFTPDSYE